MRPGERSSWSFDKMRAHDTEISEAAQPLASEKSEHAETEEGSDDDNK